MIGIIIILLVLIIFVSYKIYKLVHKEKLVPIIKESKIGLKEVESRYGELNHINNLLPRLEYLIDTRDFKGAEVLYNDIINLYNKLSNRDKKRIYSKILNLHRKTLQSMNKL